MRAHAERTLANTAPGAGEASVAKLLWANWHRQLGELAMEVQGAASMITLPGDLDPWQRLYLFSRADTIYGGSNEIQRNILAERVLGLPREHRP
jgi:alkylation response protein AidB-like acyl-CoA dehydrogenase